MKKSLFSYIILTLISSFLLSCKEKEVEVEVSPNMLISVRKSDKQIKIADVTNKVLIEKAVSEKLEKRICFFRGNVYEMILGIDHTIDLYETLDDYSSRKVKVTGEYLFDDEKYVTFMIEEESNKYKIGGAFGDQFYNHFMRQEGGGEHHVVEKNQVFSLSIDYTEELTEELKNEFPEEFEKNPNLLEQAGLKSDMVTVRRLETVKIK